MVISALIAVTTGRSEAAGGSPAAALATIPGAAPALHQGDGGIPGGPGEGAGAAAGGCAFVATRPPTVGALEAALGITLPEPIGADLTMGAIQLPSPTASGVAGGAPLGGDVARLLVLYDWDLYHSRPIASTAALRGRGLVEFHVRFSRGRAACEAGLRAAFGASTELERPAPDGKGPAIRLRRYGSYFVDAADGDAVSLDWFASEPDWAAPPVDVEARARVLRELGKGLAGARSAEEVWQLVSHAPKGAGIVKAPGGDGEVSLQFVPPMPAAALAAALGWPRVAGQSVGVHQSSFRVVVPAGARWALPRIGPWEVDCALTSAPTGRALAGEQPAAVSLRSLGPKDAVRTIRLAPRGP
ncbi:MAG: hypothetical protein IT380_16945 [Myxococcales bacterium]|nr:hypothetical protein [Myxococcales bacterium]